MKTIRLLIVDDLMEVRQGLAALLHLASRKGTWELDIVGEACNGEEALQEAGRLHPQVVLLDLEMPVMDGYEAARRMKANQLADRIVILSIHDGARERELAHAAGADAFLAKGGSLEDLLNAILEVHEIHSFDREKGDEK